MRFHVDTINVSGIRPSRLANVGLLSATLNTKNEEGIDNKYGSTSSKKRR